MIINCQSAIFFCGISGLRRILCQDGHLNIPGLRSPLEPVHIHRERFRVPKGILLLVFALYLPVQAVFRGNFDSNNILEPVHISPGKLRLDY